MSNNELMHYGVLGMKWGVHRGRTKEAYEKAVAKRNKLNNRVVKTKRAYDKAIIKANTGVSRKYKNLQIKADRAQLKADKKKYGMFSNAEKAKNLQYKADKAQYKADKYKYKYEKKAANQESARAKYLKAQIKAEKWIKAMDSTFSSTNYKDLSPANISAGKAFIEKNA